MYQRNSNGFTDPLMDKFNKDNMLYKIKHILKIHIISSMTVR